MTYDTQKKFISIVAAAGVILLSGCQSRSSENTVQNSNSVSERYESSAAQTDTHSDTGQDPLQGIYSEPERSESSSAQSASDPVTEQGSVQSSTYSEPEKTEQSTAQNTSVPVSTVQTQSTHTVSESTSSSTQSVPEISTSAASEANPTESTEDNELESKEIYIKVGEDTLTAVLEDNESAAALKELIADKTLTISASNYGGFEKVCALGTSLPRNDSQTTTQAGDICLYSGDQIVIFYGSNSWSYTRLGKISGAGSSELKRILSGAETEVTLSLKPFD
ncbi:MAG: cyclophilin-like fold protein [Bacteroides sp.]|nr:cyclophilin-like fold protein [Eubacterium sp.]MCM1463770.1 cyclophilin-like fold protein [Bacteroides sp.]